MAGLQARLEKIDASTENGPPQGRDMSRNARLVLAAAAKVPRYALPPGANQPPSGRTPKKISVSLMTKMRNTYEEFFAFKYMKSMLIFWQFRQLRDFCT